MDKQQRPLANVDSSGFKVMLPPILIVMIIVAWGAGIWQDYLKTKGWQAEARLVSNWASAARSYIGKNYTTLQASSTTTTPAVITTTM
ncbi:shufflon system plasmid conjugative transfer pilus tip adhesin PilV, partial [Klebsiella pneumoniae]